ncbi:hypothetical protein D3C87_345620 [compost metagenome]
MRKMNPTTIIFVGTIFGLIGAVIAALGTYRSGQESAKDTTEIKINGKETKDAINQLKHKNANLKIQIDTLTTTTDKQLKQIQNLTVINAKLSTQLAESTLFISQSITGGDGFCEIDIEFYPASNMLGNVVAINHGKYPLHDYNIRICDLEFLADEKNRPPVRFNPVSGKVEGMDIEVSLGTILPEAKKTTERALLLGQRGDLCSYNIFMEGKNGYFIQMLRVLRVNNNWIKATRIINGDTSEILYEKVSDDFPKDRLKW